MKNNKGNITQFVLLSMLFFTTILVSIYVGINNKIQNQEKELNKIQKSYNRENINDLYEKNI